MAMQKASRTRLMSFHLANKCRATGEVDPAIKPPNTSRWNTPSNGIRANNDNFLRKT
jgi:hypothetical protein